MLAAGKRSLAALALDYDAKGAATVSGFAAPGETVELRADGVERGQAVADQAGRFVAARSAEPLAAGAHDFELVAPSGAARFSAAIGAASPVSPARPSPPGARARRGGWTGSRPAAASRRR